jgi:hypothetical protein
MTQPQDPSKLDQNLEQLRRQIEAAIMGVDLVEGAHENDGKLGPDYDGPAARAEAVLGVIAPWLEGKHNSMYERAYFEVQKVLDDQLGTEEDDGAGGGIAGDVWLLAQQRDQARAEVDRLHSWQGLMSLLDEHYPAHIFTGESGDEGPRVLALVREVDRLQHEQRLLHESLERMTERSDGWQGDANKYGGELDDLRYALALRAFTVPDADPETMLSSLDARMADLLADRDSERSSRQAWAEEAMRLADRLDRLEKVALDRNAIFSGILVGIGGEHDEPPEDEQNWRAVGLIERHIRRAMGPHYVTQAEERLVRAVAHNNRCACISDDQASSLGPRFSRPVCAVHPVVES